MKKKYFLSFLLTLCICSLSVGQEMLLNGGLENWSDDTTPLDWSKKEALTKSTDAHTGSFSAVRTGGNGTKDLGQTITGIVPGDSYTLTVWYKVTAGDDKDARVWSLWKNGSTTVYHAGDGNDRSNDPLRGPNDGDFDNNGGVWSKYELTVTAPTGVDSFYFEVRSYSNSTVYWDDLSFVHNSTASVGHNFFKGFRAYPNPIKNGKITVTSASSDIKQVSIYNVLGKRVFSQEFTGTHKQLNVSNIATGMYIMKVVEGDKVATKKLVIK